MNASRIGYCIPVLLALYPATNRGAAENPSNGVAAPAAVAVRTAAVEEPKEGSASLSIKHVQDKITTKVTISWKQETESLLVMAIERILPSQHEGAPGETRFHEIVLISRAGAQGATTVTLANERVTEFLGAIPMAKISVYLAESVTLQFLGEPTAPGKAEASVEKREKIRPKDASPELRFVCRVDEVADLSRMMPEAKPWSFEVPEGKGIRAAMQNYDKRAFRQIKVMYGEAPP